MVFKYKTHITNVLVRTPVCKPTASQEAKGKCAKQDFCIPSTQTVVLHDPCATTYKQFGRFVNPCNTAICQNMMLKSTSSI